MAKYGHILIFCILAVVATPLFALDDVLFTVTRTKLDESKERGNNTTTVTKEIAYKVTVQSKTSKELTNVSVIYNIYYEMGELGTKEKPELQTKSGKYLISSLKATYPIDFQTDPVKIATAALDGGYYFTSGGSGYTKDKVVGVWFKAFDGDGKLIGQYVNPSTISKKMEWKDTSSSAPAPKPAVE